MNPDKHDQGKDRWDLLPIGPVRWIVKVITFGANKYTDNGWQDVVTKSPDRYYAAALRHLAAWRGGEKLDPESGLPHLACAACNLVFLMWYEARAGMNKV